MTFSELLASIRGQYVATLAEAVAQSDGAQSEPTYRRSDGELAVEGALSLPCRADLILTQGAEGGRSITVDSKARLNFARLSFSIANTKISLAPFTWDWMNLRVVGLSLQQSSSVVAKWFMRWFDPEDQNLLDSDGLRGVVHFVSDPEDFGGAIGFKIDLGSAPERALEDLLFALADAGAQEIHIG